MKNEDVKVVCGMILVALVIVLTGFVRTFKMASLVPLACTIEVCWLLLCFVFSCVSFQRALRFVISQPDNNISQNILLTLFLFHRVFLTHKQSTKQKFKKVAL